MKVSSRAWEIIATIIAVAALATTYWSMCVMTKGELMFQHAQKQIDSLSAEVEEVTKENVKLKKLLNEKRQIKLNVSAYNPVKAQCDKDPHIAADMKHVRLGTVAVSRDLFENGWVFGRKVHIEPVYIKGKLVAGGIYEIADLMGQKRKDGFKQVRAVDVLMLDKEKAVQFGRRNLKVTLLDS